MLTPRNTEFHKPRRVFLLHLNKTNNRISVWTVVASEITDNKNWNLRNFFFFFFAFYWSENIKKLHTKL